MPKSVALDVLAKRLKQVRTALGLSQAELGVRMDLPEDVASTRINRYEKGVHAPSLETAERMAKELGVSLSWLVCTDPKLAAVIDGFTRLNRQAQDELLVQVRAAMEDESALRKTPRAKRAAVSPTSKAASKTVRAQAKPVVKARPKTASKLPAKRVKPKASHA